MNRPKIILAAVVLLLMAATAATLIHMKAHQRLGLPGVKTRPQADAKNLEILLPEKLPGYSSEILTNAEAVFNLLPPDTSIRARGYTGDDGFWAQVTVVLMGSDRSSIHKPQICLTGQGWVINNSASDVENIHLDRPFPYDLPVNKLIAGKQITDANGQVQNYSGVYVYWYVDATHLTASQWRRMAWWMPRDLLLNGVLERWAYISYFSACVPGQEQATFERMKKFIAQSVPEYQLVPDEKTQISSVAKKSL